MARGISNNRMFTLTGYIDLEIIRPSGKGEYDDDSGKFIPAENEEAPIIRANVQPFKASQTFMMTDTERTKEWLNVWSPDPIRKMKEGVGGWDADKFIYDGQTFKVMNVRKYKMGVLDHYHAQACLDSPTPIGVDVYG